MSILKKGFYASQFPVGVKDPYWDDVLALIRCDGELVDLKGNCTLVADAGYKRFTEGENHLAAYANPAISNYSRFLINSGFEPNSDWTLEYTLTPHEKTVAQTALIPSFIGISSFSSRIIAAQGNSALDYRHDVHFYIPTQKAISVPRPLIKGSPLKVSIQQRSGQGIVHHDGMLMDNTAITAPIIESPDNYYLNIFALISGGTTGLGTIEEIRLTQAARYGSGNYVIDSPVFVQDKLPVPIYPKDPLYSDVVSLLRVQQGYLYDTKLNELTPRTTSSTVTGYYLDALKFTDASHKRVVTLAEPLAGNFTFEFTFSLDAINESLPFEYLLRLMDGGTPQLPVVDVLRNDDEPNKLVLTGFVSESIEIVGGFNRFAMTKTGTSLKCYLNGVLKTTTTLPSSNPISEIHLSSDTNPFNGTLEELRLTKGIRYASNYTLSDEVFPTRTGVKPEQNYLTFSSDTPFSIKFNQKSWDGVLEYSTDTYSWIVWDASEINSSGNVLYLRGSGNNYITGSNSTSYAMIITSNSGVRCTGNIMALLNHVNPDNAVMGVRAFAYLFYGQDKLITAPELPATTLADYCYSAIFQNCTNLTTAPELPATVLADKCYFHMFQNCTSLVTAPELPATTLVGYCYYSMFRDCINLATAPELPVTQLADSCYRDMFRSTGITVAPELPATVLAPYCYYSMFRDCINLATAPELPATVLSDYCYTSMFYGTGIAISETQTGVYQTPWRIPSVGTIESEEADWNSNMLPYTSGTFKGNPSINTTYYQTD